MRELLRTLKSANYNVTTLEGGIIVTFASTGTIAIGQEGNAYNVETQRNLESGPEFQSLENQSEADILALCQEYQKADIAA